MQNFHKPLSLRSIRLTALLCFFTVATLGCSGSGDSTPNEVQINSESVDVSAETGSGTSNDASGTTDIDIANMDATEVESVTDQPADDIGSESGEPAVVDSPSSTPVASDPGMPATTRVDFEITVPAFMSDQLQVRLRWGDINTTAAWQQDETWVISETFPANTENQLVVTFADRNGALTLGSVENTFRTGVGVSQTVRIAADQFDINRWDSDSDGVSNLDELIAGTNPNGDDVPQAVQAALELVPDKTVRITWQTTPGASHYRVFENPDGVSGFSDISGQLDASTVSFDHRVALYLRVNAEYLVQSCNDQGCADSAAVAVTGTLDAAIAYVKASNAATTNHFGESVSLSDDGNTLAVGARAESSSATGIDGNQNDDSAPASGAVYIFIRIEGGWQQQAYIKASNTDRFDSFGRVVSLSGDGNTLAVGADGEDSSATGINGDQVDNSIESSGAVYVFSRSGGLWQQQAYLKAANTGTFDNFSSAVSLSADGNTLAVGAGGEDSSATGIDGDQSDNSAPGSGAVYVFTRNAGLWQQQAYVKASNTEEGDGFGGSGAVSLSADGNTLAVGADGEDSLATGIDGDQRDNATGQAGAVYVFVRTDEQWQQQAYVKASNTGYFDFFGSVVSLSAEGNTLAVAATLEDSAANGINGDQSTNLAENSGAVYVFARSDDQWQQQAYVKASNTDGDDTFGVAVSLSADGNLLAVGSSGEDSLATGIDGDQGDNSASGSGAVYVFSRGSALWQQHAYLKAGNADEGDRFGMATSLSADGNTLAVGAGGEGSLTTGINGDQNDDSGISVGAVYLY